MNTWPIIFSAIAAFSATLSAGILIGKIKSNMGIVCALTAGFFIALTLFDIFPEVLALSPQAEISLYLPLIIGIAGFFFLHIVKLGFARIYQKKSEMQEKAVKPKVGLLSTIEFCSHAFLEGLAIGLSFQLDLGLGILVAVAVVSHDFCDGLSTLTLMLNSGNSKKASLGMLFLGAMAPILGAATTIFFAFQEIFLVYALSFLGGSFFYIGAVSLLPEAFHMNSKKVTITLFLTGVTIIFAISRLMS